MYKYLLLFFALLLSLSSVHASEEWNRILDLKGQWRFSIGDNPAWAETYYDHSSWETIHVPSAWEDEGFHGYNGFAWYRKKFEFKNFNNYNAIYLDMGYIDDVDQVYFNGKLIGASGVFPPEYQTAYNAYRRYYIPKEYFNSNGWQVIAVRIYDAELSGGILSGGIGLFVPDQKNSLPISMYLNGIWKFRTGDNLTWADPNYDHSSWSDQIVPMNWEFTGLQNYDGFGWYRKEIEIPANLALENLVLVLGKIDDIDQVYFNGTLIGSTGDMLLAPVNNYFENEYAKFRGYLIPSSLIKKNGKNIIAVRVYDGFMNGGIYEGPVGISIKEKYVAYWQKQNKETQKKSIWDIFFN